MLLLFRSLLDPYFSSNCTFLEFEFRRILELVFCALSDFPALWLCVCVCFNAAGLFEMFSAWCVNVEVNEDFSQCCYRCKPLSLIYDCLSCGVVVIVTCWTSSWTEMISRSPGCTDLYFHHSGFNAEVWSIITAISVSLRCETQIVFGIMGCMPWCVEIWAVKPTILKFGVDDYLSVCDSMLLACLALIFVVVNTPCLYKFWVVVLSHDS